MNLLLLGGLGYVGGRFAEHLVADGGHSLTLTTRGLGGTRGVPGAAVVAVDPLDTESIARACRDVDVVVNLAGMNAGQCARAPESAIEERAAQARALVTAARSQRVRRLVQVSSIHVYGAALSGHVEETTGVEPSHPYALSHLAAEKVLRDAAVDGAMELVIARLSNAYGAPLHVDCDCWSLVTNDLARQGATTRLMKLQTSGKQRRDFIAMSEVCRALETLCVTRAPLPADSLVNVGVGDAPSILEQAARVAAAISAELGFSPAIVTGERDDAVGKNAITFTFQRLRALGFESRPDGAALELARLARFCAGMGRT